MVSSGWRNFIIDFPGRTMIEKFGFFFLLMDRPLDRLKFNFSLRRFFWNFTGPVFHM